MFDFFGLSIMFIPELHRIRESRFLSLLLIKKDNSVFQPVRGALLRRLRQLFVLGVATWSCSDTRWLTIEPFAVEFGFDPLVGNQWPSHTKIKYCCHVGGSAVLQMLRTPVDRLRRCFPLIIIPPSFY